MQLLKTGISSIQDQGRFGFRELGIHAGGVMDKTSAFLANMLVANERTAALIEISSGEWSAITNQQLLVAFGGKGYTAFVNDRPIRFWQPHWLQNGDRIQLIPVQGGGTAYLAIHGGIRLSPVLNSRSTHAGSRFGGFQGRLLKPNDLLPVAVLLSPLAEKIVAQLNRKGSHHGLGLSASALPNFERKQINLIAGPEWDAFDESRHTLLLNSAFQISAKSNRMGYRLQGPALQEAANAEFISTAVVPGTVQVTPDGQLLILMADAQTTGGYPRIAQVAQADLSLLAQQTPGASLEFRLIGLDEAEMDYLKKEEQLVQLKKDYSLIFS
jgi:antagonist of KipI